MIHLRGIMIATYHDRKNISTIIPFKIQIRACRRRSAQLESAAVSDWRIAALGLSSSRPSFQLHRRDLGREAGSDRRKRTRGPSPSSLRLLRARGRGTQSSAPRHPLRSLLRSRQRRPLATAKTAERRTKFSRRTPGQRIRTPQRARMAQRRQKRRRSPGANRTFLAV